MKEMKKVMKETKKKKSNLNMKKKISKKETVRKIEKLDTKETKVNLFRGKKVNQISLKESKEKRVMSKIARFLKLRTLIKVWKDKKSK